MIKNPNDIVDKLIADFLAVYNSDLVGALMYGSAVTHEFVPGKSDINIAFILKDNSIKNIARSAAVQRRWKRRGLSTPFFMTRKYIDGSLDSYPVEFLDMQTGYRVLYGEDPIASIKIDFNDLRLQVERDLKGVALRLRSEFASAEHDTGRQRLLLGAAIKRLIPLFKAILALNSRKIPHSKSEIIAAVENVYGLGVSVFSDIFHSSKSKKTVFTDLFHAFVEQVDRLTDEIGRKPDTQGGAA